MIIFGNIHLMLPLLPALQVVSGYGQTYSNIKETCKTKICAPYKPSGTVCTYLGDVADPLTGECKSQCSSKCFLGICDFCYCALPKANISTYELAKCTYVYNVEVSGEQSRTRKENYCNNDYFINPYNPDECVRRCDMHSCKNGLCHPRGLCKCNSGYRLDPVNPRTCTRIPTKSDNTCQCPEGYEFNDSTSSCESASTNKDETTEPTSIYQCKDEICIRSIICQCLEGHRLSPFNCNVNVNITADDIPNLDETAIMQNTAVACIRNPIYDKVSVYIAILVCGSIISLITIIALVIVIVKLKSETSNEQIEMEDIVNQVFSCFKT